MLRLMSSSWYAFVLLCFVYCVLWFLYNLFLFCPHVVLRLFIVLSVCSVILSVLLLCVTLWGTLCIVLLYVRRMLFCVSESEMDIVSVFPFFECVICLCDLLVWFACVICLCDLLVWFACVICLCDCLCDYYLSFSFLFLLLPFPSTNFVQKGSGGGSAPAGMFSSLWCWCSLLVFFGVLSLFDSSWEW